jgi:hypothetical protein
MYLPGRYLVMNESVDIRAEMSLTASGEGHNLGLCIRNDDYGDDND